MNIDEFRKFGHELIDWISDYYENIEKYPVKSQINPRDILKKVQESPPEHKESFESIMKDFEDIVLPGITHWQSPNFFAYFPANSSRPSVLAELLTAALAVQGMVWETSPAAVELEEAMMNWLKEMMGIPSSFYGVIQDTASTSTLVALLCAREKVSNLQINENGFKSNNYRIYCSSEAHSSIDKAVKIAGFGKNSLVRIEVDDNLAMIPEKLEEKIIEDKEKGLIPVCVISAIGTTGTVAIDPLKDIATVCKTHDTWHHVDAAYAGTAMIIEENRKYIQGIEDVDSYVFNPHKWMFTNFDCSAYFVKDKEILIRTFEIMPEYLKTSKDNQVNNYRDWGIQLGRRFRALKLWFVIRSMGTNGIKEKISNHILWAEELAGEIKKHPGFELHEPQNLGLVCFRLKLNDISDREKRNAINKKFLDQINSTGKIYLSHTKVKDEFTLRLVVAQTYVSRENVLKAWELIKNESNKFLQS
ncbi:MAG: pyridoxal phosphate-dependent decarboxylase family protein [Bacteroidales bacterium]